MSARVYHHICNLALRALLVLSTTAGVASSSTPNVHAQTAQKIAPALQALMTSNPLVRLPVIVKMNAASAPFSSGSNSTLAQQAVSILNANGQAIGPLPIIDGAAGWATSAQITAMSLLPQVVEIDQDATVSPRHPTSSGSTWPPGLVDSLYAREVNADKVWAQGGYGHGVTVAVLDSGVMADTDLTTTNGNRVLARVNFADSTSTNDPGGHGTHIAGTIAGDGTKSAGQYVGVAPHANIVDVRVLDSHGNGRISSVLAGLDWVITHQAQYNIRVANLSFGAPPVGSYVTDPMAAGVEVAWRHGVVMVVAAGNGGPNNGTVDSPGIDPYAITVGSTDDQATLPLNDDTVGWWSSWATANQGGAKPDAVAPGRKVVSIRVQGSALDNLLPDHVVPASNGTTYFRLSGTSMSTAVVSGVVALLLEHQPNLDPDQVKQILLTTTQAFGQSAPPPPAGSVGAGLVDAYRARNAGANGKANQGLRHANDLAMTLYPMLYGQVPLIWKDANYLGLNWLTQTWATLTWNNIAWDNIAWDNIAWDNIAWDNIAWDNIAWDNIAWDQAGANNIAWDNIAWDNIAWD